MLETLVTLKQSRMALTVLFVRPVNYPFADADFIGRVGILFGDLTKVSELV